MRQIFSSLNNAYKSDNFLQIFENAKGNYFLKLRSLSRSELLKELAEEFEIDITGIPARKLFEHIFCENLSENDLNEFIRAVYERERAVRVEQEDDLYHELYRLQNFNWGGFYQNAVEQTIVNNYVKKIRNFNELIRKIETDLNPRLQNYILCSWYNHWTSILIEDMFKDHQDIIPAVGLVKKVDFFWHDFPFDLKVTYFPDGFMKEKRRERGLRPELTELKQKARALRIGINNDSTDDELHQELLTRITEHPSDEAREFIQGFHATRSTIVQETIENPKELIVWFYENQGIRRFDAANRFFLVLLDRNNLDNSWKLKRNKEILQAGITNYLNNNRNIDFDEFKTEFEWEDTNYECYATCLFLTNN